MSDVEHDEDNPVGFVPQMDKRQMVRTGVCGAFDLVGLFRPSPPPGEEQWIVEYVANLGDLPPDVEPQRKMTHMTRRTLFQLEYLLPGGDKKIIPTYFFSRIERGNSKDKAKHALQMGPVDFYRTEMKSTSDYFLAYMMTIRAFHDLQPCNLSYCQRDGKFVPLSLEKKCDAITGASDLSDFPMEELTSKGSASPKLLIDEDAPVGDDVRADPLMIPLRTESVLKLNKKDLADLRLTGKAAKTRSSHEKKIDDPEDPTPSTSAGLTGKAARTCTSRENSSDDFEDPPPSTSAGLTPLPTSDTRKGGPSKSSKASGKGKSGGKKMKGRGGLASKKGKTMSQPAVSESISPSEKSGAPSTNKTGTTAQKGQPVAPPDNEEIGGKSTNIGTEKRKATLRHAKKGQTIPAVNNDESAVDSTKDVTAKRKSTVRPAMKTPSPKDRPKRQATVVIELSDDTDIADMNNNEKTGVFIVSDDEDFMATRSEFFAALELKPKVVGTPGCPLPPNKRRLGLRGGSVKRPVTNKGVKDLLAELNDDEENAFVDRARGTAKKRNMASKPTLAAIAADEEAAEESEEEPVVAKKRRVSGKLCGPGCTHVTQSARELLNNCTDPLTHSVMTMMTLQHDSVMAGQRKLRHEHKDLDARISALEAKTDNAVEFSSVAANRMRTDDVINEDANMLGLKWSTFEEINLAMTDVDKVAAVKRLLLGDHFGDHAHYVGNVLSFFISDSLKGHLFLGGSPTSGRTFHWGEEFFPCHSLFGDLIKRALWKKFNVGKKKASDKLYSALSTARIKRRGDLRNLVLQRHAEKDAHPVWELLIQAELIGDKYGPTIINLPLPKRDNKEEQEEEYTNYYEIFRHRVEVVYQKHLEENAAKNVTPEMDLLELIHYGETRGAVTSNLSVRVPLQTNEIQAEVKRKSLSGRKHVRVAATSPKASGSRPSSKEVRKAAAAKLPESEAEEESSIYQSFEPEENKESDDESDIDEEDAEDDYEEEEYE